MSSPRAFLSITASARYALLRRPSSSVSSHYSSSRLQIHNNNNNNIHVRSLFGFSKSADNVEKKQTLQKEQEQDLSSSSNEMQSEVVGRNRPSTKSEIQSSLTTILASYIQLDPNSTNPKSISQIPLSDLSLKFKIIKSVLENYDLPSSTVPAMTLTNMTTVGDLQAFLEEELLTPMSSRVDLQDPFNRVDSVREWFKENQESLPPNVYFVERKSLLEKVEWA